jgi:hypothetical protein
MQHNQKKGDNNLLCYNRKKKVTITATVTFFIVTWEKAMAIATVTFFVATELKKEGDDSVLCCNKKKKGEDNLLCCNRTKKIGNDNLFCCNKTKKKGDDSLLMLPHSLQQKEEEGNRNNCHRLLHCNKTKSRK